MRHKNLRPMFWVCALLVGATSAAPAQPPNATKRAATLPPFSDLWQALTTLEDNYVTLGNDKQRLQSDADRLAKADAALEADRAALDQAKADLAARGNQPRAGYKWRCNAYNKLHDYPGQCQDQSQGGAWERDPNSPQTPAADDYFEAELKVYKLEQKVAADAAKLEQAKRAQAQDREDYNRRAGGLHQQIAALPDPGKVIQNARLTYDESAPKNATPSAVADRSKALAKVDDLWKSGVDKVGTGQCVPLQRELWGLGPAKDWTPGTRVATATDDGQIKPIATFFNGVYPDKWSGNHTASLFALAPDGKSALVYDQYSGKAPGLRVLKSQGGIDAHLDAIRQAENAVRGSDAEINGKAVHLEPNSADADARRAYWVKVYKTAGYNPSHDLDNYYEVNRSSPVP